MNTIRTSDPSLSVLPTYPLGKVLNAISNPPAPVVDDVSYVLPNGRRTPIQCTGTGKQVQNRFFPVHNPVIRRGRHSLHPRSPEGGQGPAHVQGRRDEQYPLDAPLHH